jgi:hypothetical protein
MIQNQDSSKYFGYVTPDSTGKFVLTNYEHNGKADFYIETSDAKNHPKKIGVELLHTLADSISHASYLPMGSVSDDSQKVVLASFLKNALTEHQEKLSTEAIMLKAVNIKERKLSQTDQLIKDHVHKFDLDNGFTLDMVNNSNYSIGIIDYIKGRFPGLQIYDSPNQQKVKFIYRGISTIHEDTSANSTANQPYFYVDERPSNLDEIKEISLADVALIRFAPPPVWFAPLNGGNNGALLIYTRRQSDEKFANTIRGVVFDHYSFNGYSITREFSSPDYSDPRASALTDTRSTLYWNHDINTDKDGIAKFHFYNSDKARHYRIIIQGMDAEGRLGYLDQVF